MKKNIIVLILLLSFGFFTCKKDKPCVHCPSNQVFKDNICQCPDRTYKFNNECVYYGPLDWHFKSDELPCIKSFLISFGSNEGDNNSNYYQRNMFITHEYKNDLNFDPSCEYFYKLSGDSIYTSQAFNSFACYKSYELFGKFNRRKTELKITINFYNVLIREFNTPIAKTVTLVSKHPY